MGRHRQVVWALLLAAVVGAAGAGCGGGSHRRVAGTTTPTTPPAASTTMATNTVAPSTTATAASTTVAPGPVTVTTARASPATTPTTSGCAATLASQLASAGGGTQVITVVAASTGSTSATVSLWQRGGTCWSLVNGPWPARVGYNGMSSHHREGDGTTPMGLYAMSSAFYGIAANPGVQGSYHQLVCGDWWDEDPASPQYNTFQHLSCGATPPFGGGSEQLWKQVVAYQSFAVVQYNTGPIVSGAGSGIFVHDDTGGSTNGCVSLTPPDLNFLLRWLQPGQSPHIAIGTAANIGQY
jgi:L,D-peptidoglycan transpeptidase YkuD (ErfK/YbiS/YcfS/YnhG family)